MHQKLKMELESRMHQKLKMELGPRMLQKLKMLQIQKNRHNPFSDCSETDSAAHSETEGILRLLLVLRRILLTRRIVVIHYIAGQGTIIGKGTAEMNVDAAQGIA